jgi:hypothetical protein
LGEGRGTGPLAPYLDPGLNQRLVHLGGCPQFGNVPVLGSVELVIAIAQGQASALGQQGSPSDGGLLELGDRGGFLFGCQLPAGIGRCRRWDDGGDSRTRIRKPARAISSGWPGLPSMASDTA